MSMGGGGQTSTQTSVQELSPEQRRLLDPVLPIAESFLKNPPKMFPGSSVAQFDPMQLLAQQMTMNAAGGMTPMLQQQQAGGSALMQAGGAVLPNQIGAQNFLMSGAALDPRMNPALKGVTDAAIRPMVDTFKRQILPGIANDAVSAGGFGGTRQGIAEGIATSDLNRQIGDVSASIQNNAYNQGLQAMAQMAGQAPGSAGIAQGLSAFPQILSSSLLPAQLTSAVGEQRQGMTQAQLGEQVQRYVNEQMLPFAIAQDVAAMAFGIPAGTTTTTAKTTGGGGGGGGMGMLSGIMGMIPMLAGLSDRRLKKNLKRIRKLADGLNVYSYKFVGDVVDRIGLLADEVALIYPLAVKRGEDGYLRVNYELVPTWHGEK